MDVFDSAVELQTFAPPLPPAPSLALFARPPPLPPPPPLDGPLDAKFAAASGSNAELWTLPLEPALGFAALAGLRAMGLAMVRRDCAADWGAAVVSVLVASVKKVQVDGVFDAAAAGRQDGGGVGDGLQVAACTRFWCNCCCCRCW